MSRPSVEFELLLRACQAINMAITTVLPEPVAIFIASRVTTNGIESVFAVLKRGIIGVFHQVSVKHLGRYAHEFAFRLNEGAVFIPTIDRLHSFISRSAGKRLTYRRLIA